jgi:Zn-dependent protease
MDRQRIVRQYELPQRDYEPIQPKSGLRDLLKKIWAPLAAVGALLIKFGAVLFKAKFLFSIFVSAAVYVWIGGWWFGIGLVVLLFVHEMGHVLEAKRQGLPVSAPFFIPFLGAAIQMKRMPQSAWHEALNGIAGPILGSIGAAACWAIGAYYDSRPLIALAFLGFLINLFNLIPFLPLDGGRIAVAIHPAVVALGLIGLIVLVIVQPNPILILILIVGGMETWRRWQMRNHPEVLEYYRVLPSQRIVIALLYFGLAALLVFGMEQTHVPRDF